MDKIQIVQDAEQYIKKDILYGLWYNQLFKSYIENKVDIFVENEETPDSVAKRLNQLVEGEIDAGHFQMAHEYVLDTDNIEEFIANLPYKDSIKIDPINSINISEEIRSYINQKNEDNTYGVSHKTLKELYKLLLDSNEFIPPSTMDKVELINATRVSLQAVKDDFDEINKTAIAGETFEALLDNLPKYVDDYFRVDGMELNEYIQAKYKEYSIVRYNSVESKPTNVELIKLTEDAKDVTSEYIFLTPEQVDVLVKTSKESSDKLSTLVHTILEIIKGVELAMSMDTLHAYDERISLIRDNVSSIVDNYINELYQNMITKYAKKEDQLAFSAENWEDYELLLRNDLNELIKIIDDISNDYTHTYTVDDDKIRDQLFGLIDLKNKIEKMCVSFDHKKVDEANSKIKQIRIVSNYSKENISHDMERCQDEIEFQEMLINKELRKTATTTPEQVANELRIEKMIKDRDQMLDMYLQEGKITSAYYEKHKRGSITSGNEETAYSRLA